MLICPQHKLERAAARREWDCGNLPKAVAVAFVDRRRVGHGRRPIAQSLDRLIEAGSENIIGKHGGNRSSPESRLSERQAAIKCNGKLQSRS